MFFASGLFRESFSPGPLLATLKPFRFFFETSRKNMRMRVVVTGGQCKYRERCGLLGCGAAQ
jgi:hypothetical protein